MPRMVQLDAAVDGSFDALTIVATADGDSVFPSLDDAISSDIINMEVSGGRAVQSWTGVYVHTELVQTGTTADNYLGIGLFASHDGTDVDQYPILLANSGTNFGLEPQIRATDALTAALSNPDHHLPAFRPNYAMLYRSCFTDAITHQFTFTFWIPGIPYFQLKAWKETGATNTYLSQNTVIRRMVEVDG